MRISGILPGSSFWRTEIRRESDFARTYFETSEIGTDFEARGIRRGPPSATALSPPGLGQVRQASDLPVASNRDETGPSPRRHP